MIVKEEVYKTQSAIQESEQAQGVTSVYKERPLPIYLSELSNINDYNIFANGGWDGNWYVGFDVCWMEELPPAPEGEYSKAFIGAKIGRMKTQSVKGKPPWEKEAIPGEVYIALASTPAWKSSQSYFLCDTKDIPLEADRENALEGVGEARWFWREVPLSSVNYDKPNFIALWSPTEYFVSTASSPILAGGWGSKKVNSWMNSEIRGYAPLDSKDSLKTGITVFEPAIAMKLIPKGTEQEIKVSIVGFKSGREKTTNKTLVVSVSGTQVEKVWLEVYTENKKKKEMEWKKYGRAICGPPYMFTLKSKELEHERAIVRCVATDVWGNIGTSAPTEVMVSKNKEGGKL